MARQPSPPKKFRFPFSRERDGREPEWRLELQGSLLGVAAANCHYQPKPGKRGIVEWFSPASRLRLLKKLARVDWKRVGTTQFITLSYTDEHDETAFAERTRERSHLFEWIEDQTGSKRSILWKVEFKRRKTGRRKGQWMPHVHICVFNCRFLSWKDTAERWAQLLHVKSVNVEGDVTRAKGVARYTSKYCSKDEDEGGLGHASYLPPARKGRAWGWCRQELVPWAPKAEWINLNEAQVLRGLDVRRGITGRDTRDGFTLLDDDAEQVAAFILGVQRFDVDDQAGAQ